MDALFADIQDLKQGLLERRNLGAILAGIHAAAWLNTQMAAWLGEKNAADTLAQSAPNNITSQMGLALLDVADAIRPHPAVVAYLPHARDESFFEGLASLSGGPEASAALTAYLDRYGMRGVGEIDVTRTRWSERPTTLVPLILGHLKAFEPGAAHRKFEAGLLAAARMEASLLARLRTLPDGDEKAEETHRMIRQLRIFIGYREYPKYAIVNRLFVYKRALLAEAGRLTGLDDAADSFYLTFDELREAVRTHAVDTALIAQRKAEHARNLRLTPSRVLTSEGETVPGSYHRTDLPPGALVGLAVSAGVVEGRARVLRAMGDAILEPGDIVVTPYTDPSWTPVFVSIQGLVTEVGGLMTHGAVIAREYGLPAVVGVEHATRLIRDGQRIRVHGTAGYVEVLG